MNKVKNLGCDRWWTYKQPRQKSGLCCFSFTQIYRALYGDAMFVPFWGAQTWRTQSNRNICSWVLLLKQKITVRHWKKCFLYCKHCSVSKNLSDNSSFYLLHVTQRKSLEIQTCSITIRRTLLSWNILKRQVLIGSFIWWN